MNIFGVPKYTVNMHHAPNHALPVPVSTSTLTPSLWPPLTSATSRNHTLPSLHHAVIVLQSTPSPQSSSNSSRRHRPILIFRSLNRRHVSFILWSFTPPPLTTLSPPPSTTPSPLWSSNPPPSPAPPRSASTPSKILQRHLPWTPLTASLIQPHASSELMLVALICTASPHSPLRNNRGSMMLFNL
jgi:hypothetical protein